MPFLITPGDLLRISRSLSGKGSQPNCRENPFLVHSRLLTASPTRLRLPLLALAGVALFHVPAFASCEALATLQLPNTTITNAELVPAGKFVPTAGKPLPDLPTFCRVTATLKPSPDSDIRVEIWMPQSGWNERFNGTGNGGFAGNISYNALAEGLRRGYAVANTDMGMSTPPGATASIFINRGVKSSALRSSRA